MSSLDLDQVLHARAAWRNTVLIPLWIFQVAVLLCLMGIFAYRLAQTFKRYQERNKMGDMPIVEVVWEATNVGFNLIALTLNIIEISRKAAERLTPLLIVFTQSIKLILAFAVLALDIIAYLQHMDGHYSTIGLSLDCGLLAANVAALIYAIRIYRRLLQYEDYHLTTSASSKAPDHRDHQGEAGSSLELGYHNQQHSSARGRIATEDELRHYYSDEPSPLSFSSHRSSSQAQRQTQMWTDQHTSHGPLLGHSPSTLKREVDRAVGVGFGWGAGGGSISSSRSDAPTIGSSEATTGGVMSRSGSVVVGAGTVPVVPVHHHEATEELLHRQRSWVTEIGVVTAAKEEVEEEADDSRDGGVVMGRVDEQGRHGLGLSFFRSEGGRGRDEGEDEEEALLPGK
ncbi:hypothetical protein C7999DRAFT_12215 [Corynascus novoguineensis]|uniref:Uncharacterized protein n=1 Tax=Corynascus novoguineensis TaxID=1126955 RepID=A0AAN7HT11_9PEZI|nr:hypothetical protein C7999DRAFT_12215 [Corynascus novoguineensis]